MTDMLEDSLNIKIDQAEYMKLSMNDWRTLLINEVDVYVYGSSYLAKRFDSINYEFVTLSEAKDILKDNLYSLLRYKYFPFQNDDVDKLISKIVASFTENLKTSLYKVSFESNGQVDNKVVKEIPEGCVAFKNGVFDFKNNKWLFKIYKKPLRNIQNNYFSYHKDYVILWYLDIEFEELPMDITKLNKVEIKDIFHSINQDNLAYRLIYNMSFTEDNKFSYEKFQHLCEIIGFILTSKFLQFFVFFVGSGGNGKNSLFDGCFSSHVVPKPSSLSLDYIEENQFVTGSLENKYHNFYFESPPKPFEKSDVIKQLTGSTLQSIERKGKDVRSGYLNTKHLFSANNRDKVKFNDSTVGFLRRINLFEVFYSWDARGDYLKMGNYLEVTLSPDLVEMRQNLLNTVSFVYLGIWGLSQATNNFTKAFKFTYNNYATRYENISPEVKKLLTTLTIQDIKDMILKDQTDALLYVNNKRIYMNQDFKQHFKINKSDWKECVNDLDQLIDYLESKDVYINLNILKQYSKIHMSQLSFNQEVGKYTKEIFKSYYNNQNYVKFSLIGERLKFTK